MLKKTARDRTKVLFRAVFFCFLEKPIFYWTNPLLKSEFVQFFKEKKTGVGNKCSNFNWNNAWAKSNDHILCFMMINSCLFHVIVVYFGKR